MKTSYRDSYKPGDIVEEDDDKANDLVRLGRAEFVNVEKKAPKNKEVQTTKSKEVFPCDACMKVFVNLRLLKSHKAKAHK